MRVDELVRLLELDPLHLAGGGEQEVTAAYCGDLLSDVLAHCEPGSVWFTVQAHVNSVAVADLREVACLVVVNGVSPDPQMIAKAQAQGVSLCGSVRSSAELCMCLAGRLPGADAADDEV